MNVDFWNNMADSYDNNTERAYSSANKKIIDTSVKFCKENMDILDIGCGTGLFTLPMAKHVKHVKAIDYSQKMLNIAKLKSNAENISNIEWCCEDLSNVKSDKTYDMITAFNVLVYLPHIEECLRNIYEHLDDSGYFLSVTDCLGEKNILFNFASTVLEKLGIKPKMHNFKINTLRKLIEDAGFEIVLGDSLYNSPPNYFIAARKKQ